MRPPNALYHILQPQAAVLRRRGLTNAQIAEELGTSVKNIQYWMGATPKENGGRPWHPYGLRERARYLRECGYSITEIAEEMKLPRSTVGDWVHGMPCG